MNPKVSIIIPVYNVENYIVNMLESVRRQSFGDFEALIINDGSTDGSQALIDEFAAGDSRFIPFYQENGGVASARNFGLEQARGDFVVFYDPDDIIPRDALKKMYKSAASNKADMVIGVMEEVSFGEKTIYMHSQKLAKQNKISSLDQHFFGAWSLCNKMFSLDFIKRTGLQMENVKHSEDGVFTYCALNKTDEIYGADVVSYNYYKRPFWLTPSATQIISREYLEELLKSHDRMLSEITALAASKLTPEESDIYLQELYMRFIEVEMVGAFYRNLWRASDDILPRIIERTEIYKSHITDSQWKSILKKNRDLQLENGFMTLEQLAASPLITVILAADMVRDKFNLVLGSLYNQSFLRFQVTIPEDRREELDEAYKDKLNIKYASGEGAFFVKNAFDAACSEYVIVAEEFALYTKNTLKQLWQALEGNKSLGFATVRVKHFDGENYAPLEIMEAAYGFTKMSRRKLDIFSSGDVFMGNKLIRKSAATELTFSGDGAKDAMKLYGNLKFTKIRKGVMVTDMTDDDLLAKAVKKPSGLAGLNAWKNRQIDGVINKAKRHITREDVDKIKRLVKRK